MTPLYLYAIVEERPLRPLGKGMARQPLSAVRVGKAWVVVERTAPPEPTPKALVAHDRVVRRIARACSAVLPLRFASTASDVASIASLLAPFSEALPHAFARVRGAVQFTVRVTGTPAPPVRPSRRAGPGTRWLAKRMARTQVPEIAVLTEATRPFVREVRVERHDGAGGASRAGALATVYHLVPRQQVAAWRKAVARSVPSLAGTSVTTTGPWPPYAFAELT